LQLREEVLILGHGASESDLTSFRIFNARCLTMSPFKIICTCGCPWWSEIQVAS
jgi:hypothetical protein